MTYLPIMPIDAENPFEGMALPLEQPIHLNPTQKAYLASRLVHDLSTSIQLGEKYGIPPHALRRYKQIVMKGNRFREKRGRPPLLDKIGMESVRQ